MAFIYYLIYFSSHSPPTEMYYVFMYHHLLFSLAPSKSMPFISTWSLIQQIIETASSRHVKRTCFILIFYSEITTWQWRNDDKYKMQVISMTMANYALMMENGSMIDWSNNSWNLNYINSGQSFLITLIFHHRCSDTGGKEWDIRIPFQAWIMHMIFCL